MIQQADVSDTTVFNDKSKLPYQEAQIASKLMPHVTWCSVTYAGPAVRVVCRAWTTLALCLAKLDVIIYTANAIARIGDANNIRHTLLHARSERQGLSAASQVH